MRPGAPLRRPQRQTPNALRRATSKSRPNFQNRIFRKIERGGPAKEAEEEKKKKKEKKTKKRRRRSLDEEEEDDDDEEEVNISYNKI